jgi:hypothetical protein
MSKIAFHRVLAGFVARSAVGLSRWGGADHGRQGKRPAFGAAHVVGNIEEFVNANDTRCWRFSEIAEGNQYSERHRPETHCGFGP